MPLGAGTLIAVTFVAIVWVMITCLAGSRARMLGWPDFLRDEGVVVLSACSMSIVAFTAMGAQRRPAEPWDGEGDWS
jgi:hypothetical protein